MNTVNPHDDVSFARTFLRIQDKQKRLIPLRYNPIQIKLLQGIRKRTLVLKPRQVGVSTVIKARHFRMAITSPVSTVTLAHDDRTTQALRRMEGRFYESMAIPPGFPKPLRDLNNATITTYPDFESDSMIITAGSQSGGRGMTFTHVHGSEFAYWKDAQDLIAGVLQAGDPEIILESTPNGATGLFFELCMEALEHPEQSVWTLLFFRWFDDPTYQLPLPPDQVMVYDDEELQLVEKYNLTPAQINWRRYKIAEMGSKEDFLQEFPEDPYTCFKHSGTGYFGDLDACFKAPLHPTYDSTHVYVAGCDFGQMDMTAVPVIDKTANVQVDLLRVNQQRWDQTRADILAICKKWNVYGIYCEENNMGDTNIEALRDEFYAAGMRTAIWAFNTNAATKPPLMATLRTMLHEGGLQLQDIPAQRHELNGARSKQTKKGWTVESARDKDGGHGDTVIGLALAVAMMQNV